MDRYDIFDDIKIPQYSALLYLRDINNNSKFIVDISNIMVNDISKVNDAVAISKHTMKVAHVDIITAICIVILIELIAFTGIIPAFWGAILQEVVDLITILLALLAKTKPTNPKQTGLKK